MKMEPKWRQLTRHKLSCKSYWVPKWLRRCSRCNSNWKTRNSRRKLQLSMEKKLPVEMNDTVPAKLIDSKTGNVVDSITIPVVKVLYCSTDGTVTLFLKPLQVKHQALKFFTWRQEWNPAKVSYTQLLRQHPTATDTEDTLQGATQKECLHLRWYYATEWKNCSTDEAKGVLNLLIQKQWKKPTDQPIVIPGEGNYTVNNGMVEFKPEPQFYWKRNRCRSSTCRWEWNPKAKYTQLC